MIFRKKGIMTPGWHGIIPIRFGCETNAIRRDFDVIWCECQWKSLRKCTRTRVRGGRLDALLAFLGRDSGENNDILKERHHDPGVAWDHSHSLLLRNERDATRFRCDFARIAMEILKEMHYGQISGRLFRRSAGVSGAIFRRKIMIFR